MSLEPEGTIAPTRPSPNRKSQRYVVSQVKFKKSENSGGMEPIPTPPTVEIAVVEPTKSP